MVQTNLTKLFLTEGIPLPWPGMLWETPLKNEYAADVALTRFWEMRPCILFCPYDYVKMIFHGLMLTEFENLSDVVVWACYSNKLSFYCLSYLFKGLTNNECSNQSFGSLGSSSDKESEVCLIKNL